MTGECGCEGVVWRGVKNGRDREAEEVHHMHKGNIKEHKGLHISIETDSIGRVVNYG